MKNRITISAPRPAPFFTPIYVAVDRGFLAEEGVEATVTYGGGREQLAEGEVDFLVASPGRGDEAGLHGIRMIAGRADGSTHVLMVRPEIEDVRGLEHLVVLSSKDDGLVNETRVILQHHGLDLDQAGIELTRLPGGHPDQFRMLQEGIGDGATIGAPFWMFLSKQGYRNLGGAIEFAPGMTAGGIYATPERTAREPELMRAFVRAYVRAIRFCRTHEAEAIETMLKYSAEWGVDEPRIAKEVYDWSLPHWRAEVDTRKVEAQLQRIARKAGVPAIPVEQFVDLRFLEEALAAADRDAPNPRAGT
jgi:ABC-type nitrate/sulfonate/bicarbonate transport system substrate-binding protein